MDKIVGGLVTVNGVDIWEDYGVFLVEEKRGNMENLTAILTPSEAKADTAVDIREEHGEKYSATLTPRNKARDVTLHFALIETTRAGWLKKYAAFVNFLKAGDGGWLDMTLTQLDLTLHLKYASCTTFKPLTCLWVDGLQHYASRFKVKFREPVPII